MFVTCGTQCFRLTQNDCQIVDDLSSNQEEADTRLLLHAKDAAEQYPSLVCVTEDTDVFVICLGLSHVINSKIYIRRGTKMRVRLVDITKLATVLGDEVNNALMGLHSWTGCDTVSALAGQGKLKALKIILQNQRYKTAFSEIGANWDLSNEVLDTIEEFTCKLYSRNTKFRKVNQLRYEMFRSKRGDVESGQLPPCQNTLFQHTFRANYQSAIWRRSLENFPDIPDPTQGHGWVMNEDNKLVIQWMTTPPAPEVVLGLMSCKCSRMCRPSDCSCILNGLKCTAACRMQTCSNMVHDEEELQQDSEDSSDSDDN